MKTSKLCLVAMCAALIAMSAACSYAANLLPDGGFTTVPSSLSAAGDTWLPGGKWLFQNQINGGGTAGTLSQVAGVNGVGYAARIERTSSNTWMTLASCYVPVTAGNTYTFSYWINLDNSSLHTWANVASFRDSNGTQWINNTVAKLNGQAPGWVHCVYEYTAPEGTNFAQVQFTPCYAGGIKIADAYLGTVPEPGSMAAMLSGFVGLIGFGIRRRK
ncbi:MAG: PEP-CTERM sorting domain-containing protein [Armatimonadota bacterium]|nr:PEP-CTERM sorting domain-containing protein [bacterium]